MTANVTILAAKLDNTLYVPNSVLRFRPSAAVLKSNGLPTSRTDSQQVYVVAGGKLKSVPVRLGLTDGRYTAVTSNQLQPGTQVIVRAMSAGAAGGSSATSAPMAPRM